MRLSSLRPVWLVGLLAAALLSGCITDDPPEPQDLIEPFVDPMAFLEGHDHADYAQHDLSWNMDGVGWSDLDRLPVAWGELDTHPDHDIGLVAFAWPTAGFATVDLSDPADPKPLDIVDLGIGYGADVKWSPDGEWAVLAIQAHSHRGLPSVPGVGGVPDPLAMTAESGIELFHITEEGVIHDIDAWTPAPNSGVHMVYTHRIADRDYVFTAWNGRGVGVFELKVDDPPIGARLVPVNTVLMWDEARAIAAPRSGGFSGAHDMTVIDDPILDKPLLYVAHGYEGLFVFDLSDPHDPLWPDFPLGHWKDTDNAWYMHTVQAEVLEDGTRHIVLAPEVFSDAEAEVIAPLWILDGTDLGDIELVGTWKNPGDHGAEQLRYSVHNFQLVNGRIALAHYHGGVWLLDVETVNGNTTVTPVGYHLPANDPGRAMSGIYHGVYNMGDAPTVWDVVVHKGVVWATDVNSGLYAIAAPGWNPGDGAIQSLG
ncbi:MAG: hypothetical protein KY455_10620 [Euryarchaeota archaeon]|nr:hypothetical protein [Euryarchaeota archaeon]